MIITLHFCTKIVSFRWYAHPFQCLHDSNLLWLFRRAELTTVLPQTALLTYPFPKPNYAFKNFYDSTFVLKFYTKFQISFPKFPSEPKVWYSLSVFIYVFPTYSFLNIVFIGNYLKNIF